MTGAAQLACRAGLRCGAVTEAFGDVDDPAWNGSAQLERALVGDELAGERADDRCHRQHR